MDYSNLIHIYTRQNALDDGVLIDVTKCDPYLAPRYRAQVAITAGVNAEIIADPFAADEAEFKRMSDLRLNILLMAALEAAQQSPEHDRAYFSVALPTAMDWPPDEPKKAFWLAIDGGDDGESPSITIMLQGED